MERRTFAAVLVSLIFAPLVVCVTPIRGEAKEALKDMNASKYFYDERQLNLAVAISKNDASSILQSLDDGADVNYIGQDGMTPLLWALSNNNLKAFSILLDTGANPNLTTRAGSDQTADTSPMELAAALEDSKFLKALLDHGGDPDLSIGSSGRSVLYQAARHRRFSNIRLLVDRGAQIDHRNTSGSTALMESVSAKSFDVALTLLELGADPAIKDRWGYNVADTVKLFGSKGVASGTKNYCAYQELVEELDRRGLMK